MRPRPARHQQMPLLRGKGGHPEKIHGALRGICGEAAADLPADGADLCHEPGHTFGTA